MKNQIHSDEFFNNFIDAIADRVQKEISKTVKTEIENYAVEKKIPPYLNTTDFHELTGISYKKQSYLREKKKIAYSKHKRSITYKREDVEKFLEDHRVPAKKQFD